MNIRKATVIVPTALIAGAMMLPVGVTAASASPTHTASGAVTQAPSSTLSSQDWRRGYRDGYRDGWNEARRDCHYEYHHNRRSRDDYADGYDTGFHRGYATGFDEYCR